MRSLLVLALAFGVASASVSITNIGTVGAGDTEDNPVEVGEWERRRRRRRRKRRFATVQTASWHLANLSSCKRALFRKKPSTFCTEVWNIAARWQHPQGRASSYLCGRGRKIKDGGGRGWLCIRDD